MIYMVTGLHDLKWLQNARQNFWNQYGENCGLILVENNGVSGTVIRNGEVRLRSEANPAAVMNAALAWLREKHPDAAFAKCDADDYYGPRYIQKVRLALQCEDACCQASQFVRTMSGRLWRWVNPEDHLKVLSGRESPFGPTLAARVRVAEDFVNVQPFGEDTDWFRRMCAKGIRFRNTGPQYFCYQRWADNKHAFPATDEEIRRQGPKTRWLDYGPFDPDVVDNMRYVEPEELPALEPDYRRTLMYRLLTERTHDALHPNTADRHRADDHHRGARDGA